MNDKLLGILRLGGLISNHMRCVMIEEPKTPLWDNNRLCVPFGSPYTLSWFHEDEDNISGLQCLSWNDPETPKHLGWENNNLCATMSGEKFGKYLHIFSDKIITFKIF